MELLKERFLEVLQRVRSQMDTRQGLYVLVCLGALFLAFYAYQSHMNARESKQKAQRFRELLVEFKKIAPEQGSLPQKVRASNPLAYLENMLKENQISRGRIGELTPSGTDRRERKTYRLRLQSVPPNKGLSLLRNLEKDGRLQIRRLSLERTGIESGRFDVQFQLIDPYTGDQKVARVGS